MNKIRILIVEDELIIAEDIRMQLEDLGYEVIPAIARAYEEALELFRAEQPDLVLLYIILAGDKDGIALGTSIREISDVPVIFLTSHADSSTVERAKAVNPDAYIVKPFEKKDLFSSIEIAFHRYSERETGKKQADTESGILVKDAIFIKVDYRLVKIRLHEIKYLKSDGNYIEIHSVDRNHLVRSSLKDLLGRLDGDNYLQIHKSYAINTDYLDSLDYTSAQIGDEEIPVGRKYLEDIRKALKIDL